MDIPRFWPRIGNQSGRWRYVSLLAVAPAVLMTGATHPTSRPETATSAISGNVIYVPIEIPHYPVIVFPRRIETRQQVTVRFIARGDDWATISLNGRQAFQAFNNNRDYTMRLDPGAYYLEITGVTRFDRWHSGYLDVGRDNSNVIVIRYGKNSGIQVPGASGVWIPD